MHDMAFVEATHGKNGALQLQKKYLETPKDQMQHYMKIVYAKSLDASYHEGHIGRARVFRLVENATIHDMSYLYVERLLWLMKPSASLE